MTAPILLAISRDDVQTFFGGMIGVAIFLVGAVITIAWLFLPFLILGALKRIDQTLKAIQAAPPKSDYETLTQLRTIATAQGNTVDELRAGNEHAQRSNQLLEWLGEVQQNRAGAETADV